MLGGGIGGLSVARHLANASTLRITLLEASGRIGGRIHSLRLPAYPGSLASSAGSSIVV